MSGEEPWRGSRKSGIVWRKNLDVKGFQKLMEGAYKNKFMLWISGESLGMCAVEIVTFKTAQGLEEKVVASDQREIISLRKISVSEETGDRKGTKFTLIKKEDGSKISFKGDTEKIAEDWVTEIKVVQDSFYPGGETSGKPGERYEAPPQPAAAPKPSAPPQPQAKGAFDKDYEDMDDDDKERYNQAPDWAKGAAGGQDKPAQAPKAKKAPPAPQRQGSWDDSPGVGAGTQRLHGTNLTHKYSSGDVYTGDWMNGKKHGQGTYTRADGTVYVGGYQHDKKHGQGKCTWPNKNCYVGMWADGVQSGRGELLCPDGRKYNGEWKDGKQHGKGVFNNAHGDVYDGEWRIGEKHGKGKTTSKDGNLYEGEWMENKRHGRGKHVRPDNSSYDGEWAADKKHGKGVYIYGNGDRYEGETRDGHKHGKGIFKAANGAKYMGEWEKGKKHGKGIYTSANGKEHKGYWYEDKPMDKEPAPGTFDKKADYNPRPTPQQPKPQPWKAPVDPANETEEETAQRKRKEADEEADRRAEERARERLDEDARMREANASGPVLQNLAPQLEKLKVASKKSPAALIQHVYKYHPPKKEGEVVPADFSDSVMRKNLLKAIRCYHQDKNPVDAHGLDWHLLCREITKQLNEKLDLYK